MTQVGAGAFDGLLDAGHFRHTRGSSRHPWGRQARRERRLRRRAELRRTSSSSDVPTAPRRGGVHRAGSGCHVSARARFVDEDQPLWVQFRLTRMKNFDGPRRCPADSVGVNRRREGVARPRKTRIPPSDASRPPSKVTITLLPATGDRPDSGSIGSFMAVWLR
jgi:hypothetical protein